MKLLDLFCGVGGAGEGYQRAGFDVTGVDHLDQPNNPHKFIQADALEYLKEHWQEYDVIHGSPPCQQHSIATAPMRQKGKEYPDHIGELRDILKQIKKPYIIENVPLAPIRADVVLAGYMFGLKVIKRRHFELGNGLFMLQAPFYTSRRTVKNGDFTQVVGNGQLKVNGGKMFKHHQGSILDNWRFAMGMPWAKTYKELANAIPPAYTQYIGEQIISQLKKNTA